MCANLTEISSYNVQCTAVQSSVVLRANSTMDISCATSRLQCSGICINPSSNATNCGVCGNVCTGSTTCISGVCAEKAVSCGSSSSFSGGRSDTPRTYSVNIGSGGSTFKFYFDGYTEPDQFTVLLPNGSSASYVNGTALGTITAGIGDSSCYCGSRSSSCANSSWVGQGNACYSGWGTANTGSTNDNCYTACTDYSKGTNCPTHPPYPLGSTSGLTLARPTGVTTVQVKVYSPNCSTAWRFVVTCAA